MSLFDVIDKFNSDGVGELSSVAKIKAHDITKSLGKYLKGGLSKFKKDDVLNLVSVLKNYEKNKYYLGNREIIPNQEQRDIINADIHHNIRVIAGAGTGKTTTIMCRIKYQLDNYVTPDKILVLTFNVEARKNLERILNKMIGFDINVEIRTIDSFCRKIIGDFKDDYGQDMWNYSLSELSVIGAEIMKEYGKIISLRYSHVFFDEFQDVNEEQFKILKSFADNGVYLTVIGDDSQNIYQFRGSDNYYIINFDKIFRNTKTFQITTNYRSVAEIIDLANDSIMNNDERIHKIMKTNTDDKGKITLELFKSSKLNPSIINKIRYYVDDLKLDYGDIAILARNSFHLRSIETELEKSEIPYSSLITDKYGDNEKQLIELNKVVISTIHRSKGLEWRVVIMMGVRDIEFPSQMNNNLKNIEEERRLFYVGCTRAKQYLHFMESSKNVPLSRFLAEIKKKLDIKINLKNKEKVSNKMFKFFDFEDKKKNYQLQMVLDSLSGKKLNYMKKQGMILKIKPKEIDFMDVEEKLKLNDEIKKYAFVSDFNIYCKTYFIRELYLLNNSEIRNNNVDNVINSIHLTEDEQKIFNTFNLDHYFKNGELLEDIPKKYERIVTKLIMKLKRYINDDTDGMEIVKENGMKIIKKISSYHYPTFFMNRLKKAYETYCNPKLKSENILEDIYFVSLCKKFNDGRRRLVYRNVYELFKADFEKIKLRIDNLILKFKKNITKHICDIHMTHRYRMNETNVNLFGDMDFIDVNKKTLYLIKCSEKEYTIEYLIELLSQYSLFETDYKTLDIDNFNVDIKKLCVVNLLMGKKYIIPIDDYDSKKLIHYYGELIADDRNGIRDKISDYDEIIKKQESKIDYNDLINSDNLVSRLDDLQSLLFCSVEEIDDNVSNVDLFQHIEIKDYDKKSGYIVLDIENNTVTSDIIQIAYGIYDDNHNMIKKHNSYIKDRFIDWRAKQITGITNDIIREKGEDFYYVMNKFFKDLSKVKYIVGHHVGTDISKIKSNLEYHKITININIDDFEKKDTGNMYRKIYKKSGALEKIYQELFGQKIDNAHDAWVDVKHTQKIFTKMFDEYEAIVKKEKSEEKDIKTKIKKSKNINKKDFLDKQQTIFDDDKKKKKHKNGKMINLGNSSKLNSFFS